MHRQSTRLHLGLQLLALSLDAPLVPHDAALLDEVLLPRLAARAGKSQEKVLRQYTQIESHLIIQAGVPSGG